MNKCRQQWIEETSRCQADADGIDDQGAVEVLHDDSPAVSSYANGFNEVCQVIADKNHIRTFAGDIGSRTHGNANCGFAQRGRVVDTVSEHGHHSPISNLFRDETSLLFWKE